MSALPDNSQLAILVSMPMASLVREARRRAGLTQAQLAARAGVPQSTVGRIESGARTPSTDMLERLVRAAGLEVSVSLRRARVSSSGRRPSRWT